MYNRSDRVSLGLGLIIMLALLGSWLWSIYFVTDEFHQGTVYRIIYLHVPSAFCAFFCALLLLAFSVGSLRTRYDELLWALWGRASAEVGLLFTILTLVTGSIWGKPTWGTWWTWDARLTTTLILSLLYAAYLLLFVSLPHGVGQRHACAVMGILIFADIPIIYQSVNWWRTLHQPPSLSLAGSPAMDKEIVTHLALCVVLLLLFSIWLVWQRRVNLGLQQEFDRKSVTYMRGHL